MAKFALALLVLVAVYAAEARYSPHQYEGCFNGYNYDCCKNRRPNFCYPSLSKPAPYYYKCVNRRLVYGRCGANSCVNKWGTCGYCRDSCKWSGHHSYYPSYNFYGRYYGDCYRGKLNYHSCRLNQSYYPKYSRCGCRENYCERYSGWQASVCNGCGQYVFCKWGRPLRYKKCPTYRRYYDCKRRCCVSSCRNGNCCGKRH